MTEPAPPPSASAALAGAVAGLEAGEARPGQQAMADAVEAALATGRHAVVQAGTGTGKSLAYLVPAALAGETVVVATATKALQDQLATKDLPFLATRVPGGVAFAVLKGRANYVCVQRVREVEQSAAAGGATATPLDGMADETGADPEEVARLIEWSGSTTTGDRAELPWEPSGRAWGSVSVTSQECPGVTKCPSGDACFAERARREATKASVIVVNTHLYGTHLASGDAVLPEHAIVIFDEAHEVEDVMAGALGVELSPGRFLALSRTVGAIIDDPALRSDLEGLGTRLAGTFAGRSSERLAPTDTGLREFAGLARGRVERAQEALRKIGTDRPAEVEARKTRAQKACTSLLIDLDTFLAAGGTDVLWVEGPPHAPVLRLAPVDVAQRLREAWADRVAVFTSATIPPTLPVRLGLPPDRFDVLDVGSPFDYRQQALLYCARHLPDPRTPAWPGAAIDELAALIIAAGGRTLALFTSWRMMREAAEAIDTRIPYRVLTQSDLPKPALLEAFSTEESTCLFATMSFWQGVDVPGRALSLVVIDKLPFPRPDEPLLQARRDLAGDRAFFAVDIPRAATLLAQGAGRLIRSATDRGVVAVLDPRLATARYRRELLALVPPMKRSVDRAEVEEFLAAATAEPVAHGTTGVDPELTDGAGPSAVAFET